MVEFAVALIERIGLLGAGVLIALETVVMPLPSEVVLLLTGFNVSTGSFTFPTAIAVTTGGSVLGASLLYAAGFFFSAERLEHLTGRFGKYVGISTGNLRKTMNWFDRHGPALVFFGRLIPIIRSLVSVSAGLVEMNFAKFLLWTTLGAGLWNTIWISLGFGLGENWHIAEEYSAIVDYVAYAVIGASILYVLVRILLQRSRARREPA